MTDKKPEKKRDFNLLNSDNKIRKNLFCKPSIEEFEKKNKVLTNENHKMQRKSMKTKIKIVNFPKIFNLLKLKKKEKNA